MQIYVWKATHKTAIPMKIQCFFFFFFFVFFFFLSSNYSGNICDESKRETDYFFAVNFKLGKKNKKTKQNKTKKHLRHTTSLKVAIQKQKNFF